MSDFNRPVEPTTAPPPSTLPVAARVGTPPLNRVGANPLAPGSETQTTTGPNGANVDLGSQYAEGSGPPVSTAEQKAKDKPAAGSKESEVARLSGQYADLTAEQKQALQQQKIEQAKLFSTAEVTKATADLDPNKAAEQRITNARKILIELEALGMTPDQARAAAGMDDRILKEVDRQQQMVDELSKSRAGLTDEQMAAARDAAAMRQRNKEHPGSVTEAEHQALLAKLGGQEALDKLPPETRLLLHGFSPDEIADHFTARDKDADVLVDPNDPSKNTDKRGEGALADKVQRDGSVKSLKDGDRNDNAQNGDRGTVRRPMTPEEADRAIDMNAVLDQSWHAGNKFGKIIPENTVGNLQTGRDTYRDDAGKAQGGRATALTGDIGELANTAMTPARDGAAPTAAQQIRTAGLDYPSSPYVERDASGKLVPKKDASGGDAAVHRLEGTITPELENNAEVQVGNAVMARAQQRSQELAKAQADHATATGQTAEQAAADPNAPHVPKMLRRDSSPDQMPGMAQRQRESQIDPRTGLGYSVTESADMGVVPNQERKMSSALSFDKVGDATVTRSDLPNQPVMALDPSKTTFSPTGNAPDPNRYGDLKTESATRASEVEAAKAAAAAKTGSGTT